MNRDNLLNIGVSTAILIVVFLIKGPSNNGGNFFDIATAILTGQDINLVQWQNETLEKELERLELTPEKSKNKKLYEEDVKPYRENIKAHTLDTNSLREFFSEALVQQIETSDMQRARVMYKDLFAEIAPHVDKRENNETGTGWDYDPERISPSFSGSAFSIESRFQSREQLKMSERRTYFKFNFYNGKGVRVDQVHHKYQDVAMRFFIRKEEDSTESIYNPLGLEIWQDGDFYIKLVFHLNDGSKDNRTSRDKVIFSTTKATKELVVDEFSFRESPSIRSDNFYEIEILMIKNQVSLFSNNKLLKTFDARYRYNPDYYSSLEWIGGFHDPTIYTNGYRSEYTLKDFSIVSLK